MSAADDTSKISLDELVPTYPTFRNFISEGPNKRGESGKSQQELLASNETSELDRVPFFGQKRYYSAAWLSSMQTFLNNKNTHMERRNSTTYIPNLEAGTFLGIDGKNNFRTVDMFDDFLVHHMSCYKGSHSVESNSKSWKIYMQWLAKMEKTYERMPFNNPKQLKNGKVLVLMPFHAKSDNHSKEDEKKIQLNITVKSLARVFPNIVVTVCDEANYDYIMNDSGLNQYLYDILLVKSLTNGPLNQRPAKCTYLPALSSMWARERIREGSWVGFEWVYYTESDSPLHLRNVNELLRKALTDERTAVVPHRSFPTPLANDLNGTFTKPQALKFMNTTRFIKVLHDVPDLLAKGCCFNSSLLEGKEHDFFGATVEIFWQHNVQAHVAGTCNPYKLTCNPCNLFFLSKEGDLQGIFLTLFVFDADTIL